MRLCEFLIWEKWQVLQGRLEQMGRRVHHLHGLSWRIWRRKIWWWAESRSFALLLIHLHRLLLWIRTRLSGFSLVPLNLRSRKPLGSLLCRFLSPFFIEFNFFFRFCLWVFAQNLFSCSLFLQYHPDVCRGNNCGVQFHLINEAYDVC